MSQVSGWSLLLEVMAELVLRESRDNLSTCRRFQELLISLHHPFELLLLVGRGNFGKVRGAARIENYCSTICLVVFVALKFVIVIFIFIIVVNVIESRLESTFFLFNVILAWSVDGAVINTLVLIIIGTRSTNWAIFMSDRLLLRVCSSYSLLVDVLHASHSPFIGVYCVVVA